MNLLSRISNFENLVNAYNSCAKGKKKSLGYQKTVFNTGEMLLTISDKLKNNQFKWGKYREFYVTDPKRRLIMAAPFLDRVVHHGIHQIIEPILDKKLSDCVFACRKGKGNRFAAQHLIRRLHDLGHERYALKLDVSQYFASISHLNLMKKISQELPDESCLFLLESLVGSHDGYANQNRGIPIGNLTSQLFANFYLASVDKVVCQALGHPYYWLEESKLPNDVIYIRYMDDLLLIGKTKKKTCEAGSVALEEIHKLELEIPVRKRVHLENDPIPFLGYLISINFFKPLSRNIRKFNQRQSRLKNKNTRISEIRIREMSFLAWANLNE